MTKENIIAQADDPDALRRFIFAETVDDFSVGDIIRQTFDPAARIDLYRVRHAVKSAETDAFHGQLLSLAVEMLKEVPGIFATAAALATYVATDYCVSVRYREIEEFFEKLNDAFGEHEEDAQLLGMMFEAFYCAGRSMPSESQLSGLLYGAVDSILSLLLKEDPIIYRQFFNLAAENAHQFPAGNALLAQHLISVNEGFAEANRDEDATESAIRENLLQMASIFGNLASRMPADSALTPMLIGAFAESWDNLLIVDRESALQIIQQCLDLSAAGALPNEQFTALIREISASLTAPAPEKKPETPVRPLVVTWVTSDGTVRQNLMGTTSSSILQRYIAQPR